MPKIRFLFIIVAVFLLNACSLRFPSLSIPTFFTSNASQNYVNALVSGEANNPLVKALKTQVKRKNAQAPTIVLGDEIKSKRVTIYDNGKTIGYRLGVEVPVRVFSVNHKLLLKRSFQAQTYYRRTADSNNLTQADKLDIAEHYQYLRQTVIKKILRMVKQLDK